MLILTAPPPLLLLAVAGRYTGPDGKLLEIRNVWVDNLEEEMAKVTYIASLMLSFNCFLQFYSAASAFWHPK
jgi:hypothetical protein